MNISSHEKPICILVIGGPASGKGTFCKRLSEEFGIIHLSIGEVLREERNYDTDEGKFLDFHMKEFESTGALMPVEIVAQFLIRGMERKGWEKNLYLIDGFIKAKAGYDYWIEKFSRLVKTKFVLYLECSKEEMLRRMRKRSETSERLDDNENIFSTRIKTFFERTYPNVERFEDMGMVRKVNTEQNMETVYTEIKKHFYKYFPDFKYE
jgi:UMP-CMP kinase